MGMENFEQKEVERKEQAFQEVGLKPSEAEKIAKHLQKSAEKQAKKEIEIEKGRLSEDEAHDLANLITSKLGEAKENRYGVIRSEDYEKAEKEILELEKWAKVYNNTSEMKKAGTIALDALKETLLRTPILVSMFALMPLWNNLKSGVLEIGAAGYVIGKYIENFNKSANKGYNSKNKLDSLSSQTEWRLRTEKEDRENLQRYEEDIEQAKNFDELFAVIEKKDSKRGETASDYRSSVSSLINNIKQFIKEQTPVNLAYLKHHRGGLEGTETAEKIANKVVELMKKEKK